MVAFLAAGILILALGRLEASVIIAETKGKVDFKRAGYGNWVQAASPVILYKGDEVRTGWFSKADLAFSDGSKMRLGAGAHFTLKQESRQGISVFVALGQVQAWVRKAAGRRVLVRTPTAVAAVRGTVFQAEVAADGRTSWNLYDGRLGVNDIFGGRQDLQPYQRVVVGASGKMEALQTIPPGAQAPQEPAVAAPREAVKAAAEEANAALAKLAQKDAAKLGSKEKKDLQSVEAAVKKAEAMARSLEQESEAPSETELGQEGFKPGDKVHVAQKGELQIVGVTGTVEIEGKDGIKRIVKKGDVEGLVIEADTKVRVVDGTALLVGGGDQDMTVALGEGADLTFGSKLSADGAETSIVVGKQSANIQIFFTDQFAMVERSPL